MSICWSLQNGHKNLTSKFSNLVLDRDLGLSRGHQSYSYNNQIIKCLTFSESQDQAHLIEIDGGEEEDKDEKVKDNKDNKEEDDDNIQIIKCLAF